MIKRTLISVLLLLPVLSAASETAKIVKMYSTGGRDSFVGLRDDGTITAWGDEHFGGRIPQSVLDGLNGHTIKEIYPNACSFALLTEDGMVMTWGGSDCGGDSQEVAGKLSSDVVAVVANKEIPYVYSSSGSFAALKKDGSVVTWGLGSSGGDPGKVASQLESGVNKIFSGRNSFAALKNDGSVVTWGWAHSFHFYKTPYGGKGDVSLLLRSGVKNIFSSDDSFIALKDNGQLIGWGGSGAGNDVIQISHNIQYSKNKVIDIICNSGACVALKDNGSALVWGEEEYGGTPKPSIINQLRSGVVKIVGGHVGAFAVLKSDGTVVTWGGNVLEDGIPSEYVLNSYNLLLPAKNVQVNLPEVRVTDILTNGGAFVALRENGSVVSWGLRDSGADNAAMTAAIGTNRVQEVIPSLTAFAALKTDGSVVTWGDANYGGDSNDVSSQLESDVIEVIGSSSYFSALKNDGTTVTWGGWRSSN